MVANKNGETFVAQEMMVKTRFGEYKVHSDIFNAQSYLFRKIHIKILMP